MTHIVAKEKADFEAIKSGKMSFFVHKIGKYAVDPGEKIIFQETKDGEHTGEEFEAYAGHTETEGLAKNRQAIAIYFSPTNAD